MEISRRVSAFCFIAVAVLIFQMYGSEAQAQSSYFTSQGCSGCHSAPVVASCDACHAHGTHPSSAKSSINVAGVTNKTTYAPGETVSVTMTGGYRTGWFRAVLYDQNNVQVARSTGNASGMGSSTTYPAVLTAPAPATPGTYTWKAAWYGNKYDAGGAAFGTGWVADATNPNHGEERVSTNSFTVASVVPPSDVTAPVISSFTMPATASSLVVAVSTFSASDNVAVTGYIITESPTAPAAAAAGWSASAPSSVTASGAGARTFYAWAKDAAGNVSLSATASVIITIVTADVTAPVVSSFTMPATASSLVVAVSTFSASDNVAVTGYKITESSTAPAASAAGWTATAPSSVTASGAGARTFYAWAKDAAGNVSLPVSASVTITLPPADAIAPVVSSFTLPATADSLTVAVSTFSATDNVAVTGYKITESATAPAASAAGWTAVAPTSVTASGAGSITFYAWAKDAAGNVSAGASATVTITAVVPAFSLNVSTLADGSYTNEGTLNVSGTVVDTIAITSVTVNRKPVTLLQDGSFTTALRLKRGDNTITVTAVDAANVKKVDTRVVHFDPVAPHLRVLAPADNSTTAQSFITVTGIINELSTVTATVNDGAPQSASITGKNYSVTLTLQAGINTINITAVDLAGNTSQVKRSVVYDSAAPALAVTDPGQDMTTTQSKMLLQGTVTDALSNVKVSITVNNKTFRVPVKHDGSFQRMLTFVVPQLYAITVTAKDEAGNISTVQRNVIYQPAGKGDGDDD